MRTRSLLAALLLLSALLSAAQYRVTLRIVQRPGVDTGRGIYLAGSFNNWSPGDAAYRFSNEAVPTLTLRLPRGRHEFKLTRGGWDGVETTRSGQSVDNRILHLNNDTTMNLAIEEWADDFPTVARRSTASPRVQVIDTAFYMPQLKRHRRIWIYLPEGYAASKQRYPVIYMQDGQNLFDDATSAYGEWGVDEAMDSLGRAYGQSIIVGIDHGGAQRINEYAPYDMKKFGKGEGDHYADFLALTLKPFIDGRFRTRPDAASTSVAGSSMGGLISFYTILKYPRIFGAAGVFSPAFWINPAFRQLDPKKAARVNGRLYFYAGGEESDQMVSDMLAVMERMQRHSKARMETVIRAGHHHSEAAWRAEFSLFYAWIMQKK